MPQIAIAPHAGAGDGIGAALTAAVTTADGATTPTTAGGGGVRRIARRPHLHTTGHLYIDTELMATASVVVDAGTENANRLFFF